MSESADARIVVPASQPMLGVLGVSDALLRVVENSFPDLDIHVRGNDISLSGPEHEVRLVEQLYAELLAMLRTGQGLTPDTVERSIGMLRAGDASPSNVLTANILSNRGKTIRPKTLNQKHYVDAIDRNTVTFGIGPAGTGKTYLAVAKAVQALQRKDISRIILTRPAVEAGERLGFLPGTLSEKIDPYLRPLYDALHDMIDPDSIPRLMTSGTIEVAPLAYMRGRTLNDAFIILDEAQNTTPEQMKMFLTRLGFGSTMVVTGDVTQVDLPGGQSSGLRVVQEILTGVDDVAFCQLDARDVVRHELVGRIVSAYGRWDELNAPGAARLRRNDRGDVPDGLDVRDDTGEGLDTSDIEGLARFLLARLGMADDAELSITLVDEHAMAELHVEWMDEPGSTDVLSFPMDELREPAPGQPPVSGVLGDVVVCPAVARRQAVVAGHDETHEVRILVAHGVLHLLGHDHVDPAEERVMFERQQALVAEYAQGLSR